MVPHPSSHLSIAKFLQSCLHSPFPIFSLRSLSRTHSSPVSVHSPPRMEGWVLGLLSPSATAPPCCPPNLPSPTALTCTAAGPGFSLPPSELPSEPLLVLVVLPDPLPSSPASGLIAKHCGRGLSQQPTDGMASPALPRAPLPVKGHTTYLIPGGRCGQHLDSSLSLIHAIP